MPVSVGDAIRDGLGRTFERNGLQLVAVFVVVRFASAVASNTLTRANLVLGEQLGTLPSEFAGSPLPGLGETPTPFALGVGIGGAYLLFLAVALLAEATRIVGVRTLVSERTDAIPGVDARRNLGSATVNGFVGGLVVYTLTFIGLLLFVFPGVFLALSFFFVRQEIAVRDVNFVEAMSGSWELAAGNRLELLAIVVVILVVGLVASIPGFVVSTIAPAAGTVVSAVVRAFVVVFGIASVTRAYAQVRRSAEAADDEEADPFEGALGPDDLPPPDEQGR